MTEKIFQSILSNLNEEKHVFVFPSEIAAGEWAYYTIVNGGLKAFFKDRFISWDVFKERCFSLFRNEKPVNKTIRAMYSAALLEKNKSDNDLEFLIPGKFSGYGRKFIKVLESVLSGLNMREKLLALGPNDKYLAGLNRIYDDYAAFLKAGALFEPAGMKANIDTGELVYHIFFPEIIIDFDEFKGELLKTTGVKIKDFENRPNKLPKLVEFDTSAAEQAAAADMILEKLLAGGQPEKIAVSVAGDEQWTAAFLRELDFRGIPYVTRSGSSLASSAGASIFSRLGSLLSGEFAYADLRAAFADNSVPWKNRDDLLSALNILAERNYLKNSDHYRGDRLRGLIRTSGNQNIEEWYDKFKAFIRTISKAPDFMALNKAVNDFLFAFIDAAKFGEIEQNEYRLCLEELNSLKEVSLGYPELRFPGLYDFYLERLRDKVYVPRQKSYGVNIYPYRVAAGAPFDLHLVLCCDQASVRVAKRNFAFLREDKRALLDVADNDFSGRFTALYSGFGAYMSFARKSWNGVCLPPGYFFENGELITPAGGDEANSHEKELWSGGDADGFKTFPIAVSALESRLDTLGKGTGGDFSAGSPLPAGQLSAALERFIEDGLIKVSATFLDGFLSCPFAFLFERLFSLEEQKRAADFVDHIFIGNVLHHTLEKLYKEALENGPSLSSSSYEELKAKLAPIFKSESVKKITPYFEAAYQSDMNSAFRALTAYLDEEYKENAAAKIEALEKVFEFRDQSAGILYNGKIDRISSKDGETYIVDYKKGGFPSVAEIRAAALGGSSCQVPFYVFLAGKNGIQADKALYYSFRDGRYKEAMGNSKTAISKEEMETIIEKVLLLSVKAVGSIRNGNFPARKDGCSDCDLRGLCRIKFVLA